MFTRGLTRRLRYRRRPLVQTANIFFVYAVRPEASGTSARDPDADEGSKYLILLILLRFPERTDLHMTSAACSSGQGGFQWKRTINFRYAEIEV